MSHYTPVNSRSPDMNAIDDDVQYAIHVANTYLEQVLRLNPSLDKIRILELGPGINLGPLLILASHGAKVIAADRFLTPWSDRYHREFYERLRRAWDGPSAALDLVVSSNGYHKDAITLLQEPAEALRSIESSAIDCVFSNAVLEHVFDLPAVCRELGRVTKVGGVNSHQVDFRHHSDFSRPLEFLLSPEREFRTNFRQKCGELGNRWRPSEVEALFTRSGFELLQSVPTQWAEDSYLDEFVRRLRATSCRYKTWPVEDLRVVSARFELRRVNGLTGRLRGAARFWRGELRKVTAGGWGNIPYEASFSSLAKNIKNRLRPLYKGELGNYEPESGHCWLAAVPQFIPSDNGNTSSPLELFENGRPLGPAHAAHVDIRRFGKGRYSHWGPVVYFSTSDNSDPRTNSRRYSVVERRRRWSTEG